MNSTAYFRAVIDCMGDPVFAKDRCHKFVFVNDAACEMLGKPRDQVLGKTDYELFPKEQADVFRRGDDSVFETGEADVSEERISDAQGNDRAIVTKKTLYVNEGGEKYVIGVMQDITEREKAKAALHEEREKFQTMSENAPFGTVMVARDGTLAYINPKFRELFGYDPDDIPDGRTWFRKAYPDPEYRHKVIGAWVSLTGQSKSGEKGPYTFTVTCKDGTEKIINFLHVLLGTGDYIMTCEDITERKRAEEALLESEVKYRTIVENSLAGVYVYQDGLFRFVNKRFCEIYGYAYEELVDKLGPMDMAHPEERHVIQEHVTELSTGALNANRFTHRAVRKDGTTITVNVLANRITYRGRPAGTGTIYDITEQERAEEQLRQKTALLEAQVNASLDGIIVVKTGRKILQNQQVNDLLKIPRHIAENDDDEAQVEWVRGLSKDPEHFYEKTAYMLAHRGETMRDELELKDGTVLDRYTRPVIDKDGKYYGRIWTFRDITERKRAEEALRAKQLELWEMMDLARVVYWESDPVTSTYLFNDPSYALYGTTAEQEGGYRVARKEYVQRFVHPDDRTRYYQFVEQGIANPDTELVTYLEYRIIRRDGEVRHVLGRRRIVKDDSGRIVKKYGAHQDITERKQAEEALRDSEATLRSLINATRETLLLVDLEGKILVSNKTNAQRVGRSVRELIGASMYEDFPPDVAARRKAEYDKVVRTGQPVHFFDERAGRAYESYGYPVFDNEGRVAKVAIFAADITGRKRSEEEIRRHVEELDTLNFIGRQVGASLSFEENAQAALKGILKTIKPDITFLFVREGERLILSTT